MQDLAGVQWLAPEAVVLVAKVHIPVPQDVDVLHGVRGDVVVEPEGWRAVVYVLQQSEVVATVLHKK